MVSVWVGKHSFTVVASVFEYRETGKGILFAAYIPRLESRIFIFSRPPAALNKKKEFAYWTGGAAGLEAFNSYRLCFASDEEDSASSLELTISLSLFNYIFLHNFYYRHGQTFIVFTSRCPKNVENFSTHSGNGYYNTHIFHRVIH